MTKLEVAKIRLELSKVKAAKEEMEYRILEREEDINRIKENIINQDKRIMELDATLQGE